MTQRALHRGLHPRSSSLAPSYEVPQCEDLRGSSARRWCSPSGISPSSFLPDKAIDLIDEACSDLNLKDPDISRRMQIQRELDDYEKERTMLEEKEEKAEGDYARMAGRRAGSCRLTTGSTPC